MTDHDKLFTELLDLLAGGRKIEAIKRLREATGMGLAEAKAAVDRLEQGSNLPAPPSVDPALEREVVSQLEQGRKIAAIKIYREATGARLKEAKEAVEAIAERHGISRMAKSGCVTLVLLMLLPLAILSGLL
jgi:ribosomal protein L7/L12